jgi:hypothetical protein
MLVAWRADVHGVLPLEERRLETLTQRSVIERAEPLITIDRGDGAVVPVVSATR